MCSYCDEDESRDISPEEAVDILRGVVERVDDLTEERDRAHRALTSSRAELDRVREQLRAEARVCSCGQDISENLARNGRLAQYGISTECPVHGHSAKELVRAFKQADIWREVAGRLKDELEKVKRGE